MRCFASGVWELTPSACHNRTLYLKAAPRRSLIVLLNVVVELTQIAIVFVPQIAIVFVKRADMMVLALLLVVDDHTAHVAHCCKKTGH
jgi:hypothetical protein